MGYQLLFSDKALAQLRDLERDRGLTKRLKAVRKTLWYLESNPRHPGLRTHEYKSLAGPSGEKMFEAYAEQGTPAAYRIFWYYGREKGQITVVAITRHP